MNIDRTQFRGVYYVETNDPNVNHIAIRPEITPKWVAWEDTGNGRSFSYKHLKLDDKNVPLQSKNPEETANAPESPPEVIEFSSDKGTYKLKKMTKEIFDKFLKNKIPGGGRLDFKSDQEVQDYYLKTNFQGGY